MTITLHWKEQIPTESFFHVSHLGLQFQPFMPLHSHDYGEIFYVERGSGIHEVNGELQSLSRGNLDHDSSNHRYPLHPRLRD